MNTGSIKNNKSNNNKINVKESGEQNKAFSLIELSIVLIIIGLLVAGVTGGQSLINSARQRAFINEFENYKKSIYASLAVNGRLPADLNNDGYSGPCKVVSGALGSGCIVETYTINSFAEPYNLTYSVPNSYSAPFVDLYLSKIIDFRPDPSNINIAGKGYPYSKVYKDGHFYFTSMDTSNLVSNTTYYLGKMPSSYNLQYNGNYIFEPKVFKKVDEKIDDGIYNSGNIRGRCRGVMDGNTSYDDSIARNGKCATLNYKIKND